MSDPQFARALATVIAPGGELGDGVTAPAADALVNDAALAAWLDAERAGTAAILSAAGGAEAFAMADTERRAAALRRADAAEPVAVARLVAALLTLYYQHPSAIASFGWRADPPQPQGHALAPFDAALLERVKARAPFWRRAD